MLVMLGDKAIRHRFKPQSGPRFGDARRRDQPGSMKRELAHQEDCCPPPLPLGLLGSPYEVQGRSMSHQPRNRWACSMHQAGPDQPQSRAEQRRHHLEPQEKRRGQTPAASPTAKLPKVLDVLVSFARASALGRTGPFLAGLCNELPPRLPASRPGFRRRDSRAEASHGRCLKRLAAQVSLSLSSSPSPLTCLLPLAFLHFCHFILGAPFQSIKSPHNKGPLVGGSDQVKPASVPCPPGQAA